MNTKLIHMKGTTLLKIILLYSNIVHSSWSYAGTWSRQCAV